MFLKVALFLSTTINKLDKKGRISLPANFRAVLNDKQAQSIVLFKSPVHECLEGFDPIFVEEISGRLDDGFDMFSTSSIKPLNLVQQNYVYRKFRELAYMLQKRLKSRPQLAQELRMVDAVKTQHALQDPLEVQDDAQKALFDGVTLTAKELLYLEYLMMNLTHKEIAFRHQCSETAVRKVIGNVKKKLGQDSMPCSMMFQMLKERGVLIGLTHKFMPESYLQMQN